MGAGTKVNCVGIQHVESFVVQRASEAIPLSFMVDDVVHCFNFHGVCVQVARCLEEQM